MRHLGVPASHDDGNSPPADCRALLQVGVEVWEQSAIVRQNHITLRHAEVTDPAQGHTVTIDGQDWVLTDRVDDDEVLVTFAARKA